jgi:hypothetical protein
MTSMMKKLEIYNVLGNVGIGVRIVVLSLTLNNYFESFIREA